MILSMSLSTKLNKYWLNVPGTVNVHASNVIDMNQVDELSCKVFQIHVPCKTTIYETL